MIKLSERETRALQVLSDHYHSDCNCLYLRTIAEHSGVEPKLIRRVVRSLARKGMAELVRGLFDDDGRIVGSGYCCTRSGYENRRGKTDAAQ